MTPSFLSDLTSQFPPLSILCVLNIVSVLFSIEFIDSRRHIHHLYKNTNYIKNTIKKIFMKLKHLQSALSSVPTPQFIQPNVTLEQYATSPELTSYIIHTALQNEDIGYCRTVLDLGCGTGMLSIGSALVGSSHVILVDCDESAMNIARENI